MILRNKVSKKLNDSLYNPVGCNSATYEQEEAQQGTKLGVSFTMLLSKTTPYATPTLRSISPGIKIAKPGTHLRLLLNRHNNIFLVIHISQHLILARLQSVLFRSL